MNDINSLPPVPQGVIDHMQAEAEKKMQKDGVAVYDEQGALPVQEAPEPEENAQEEEHYHEEHEHEEEESPEQSVRYRDTSKETNMRYMRESRERAERERDEAIRAVRELENKYKQPAAPEEDDSIVLGEDDLAEGKHLTKVQRQIHNLRKELQSYKQQSYEKTVEVQINAQYPDFYSVVTQENLESLRARRPHMFQALQETQDLYAKSASAYEIIKELGISVDKRTLREKEMAQKNSTKPKSTASIQPRNPNESPLTKANAFAEEFSDTMKEKLRKEMFDAMKSR